MSMRQMLRSARRIQLERELLQADLIEQQLRERRGEVALALTLGMKIGLCRALDGDGYLGLDDALERVKRMGVRGTFCVLKRETVKNAMPRRPQRRRR